MRRIWTALLLACALSVPVAVFVGMWPQTTIGAGVGPTVTPMNINLASTSVTTAWTTIGTTNRTDIRLAGRYPSLAVTVANLNDGNSTSLSDFRIQWRAYPHVDAPWHSLYSGTDWYNAAKLNGDSDSGIDANSAYVNTLGAGQSVGLILSLGPVDAVRFQAKTAASTTNVTIDGLAK